jgi:hypothetical protein
MEIIKHLDLLIRNSQFAEIAKDIPCTGIWKEASLVLVRECVVYHDSTVSRMINQRKRLCVMYYVQIVIYTWIRTST